MGRPKKDTGLTDQMLAQIQSTAEAEFGAKQDGSAPDFVEVAGVRYYKRQYQPTDPHHVAGAPIDRETGEEMVQITINIAPHASSLRIDNKFYFHGFSYWIREDQLSSFLEVMDRTWRHERATGGANSAMIGAHNTHLGPHGVVNRSIGVAGRPGF